jgi:hypothetical protein
LLIRQNAIRSAVEEAAWSAIGQETKASLRQLSRGSNPCGYPHKPLVSYRINRQLSGWDSFSTDDWRLWGALPTPDMANVQTRE